MTKRAFRLRAISSIVGSAVVIATPAIAADAIFLNLLDVQGESTESGHAKEIVVDSYSQSVSNSAAFATGGGSTVGKASCGDIVITKRIDKSSPALIMKVLTGAVIPSGQLSFRRIANYISQDYYTVQLTGISITAVEQNDGPANPSGVMELIKLKARTFRLTYTPQTPDGSLSTPQTFGFDCSTNQRL